MFCCHIDNSQSQSGSNMTQSLISTSTNSDQTNSTNTDLSSYAADLNDENFEESIYDQVESFLDNEGLFIASPSVVTRQIKLKPAVNLKKLLCQGVTVQKSSDVSGLVSARRSLVNKDMPSFLARRTIRQATI